jgi:cytoskeleton protein RodZ
VNEPIPLHVAPPPAPETGTGPGARLQAARVERGLEVAVAAQALHVAPRIIEAIESDRYEVFDAPVYARGFLRAYARLLNVPADEVLARYDALTPDPPAPTLIPPANAGRLPRDWSGLRKGAVLVLALAAVGTSYWWWMGRVAPTEPATSVATVAPATALPASTDADGEVPLGATTSDPLAAGEGTDLSAAPASAANPAAKPAAGESAPPAAVTPSAAAAPAKAPAMAPATASSPAPSPTPAPAASGAARAAPTAGLAPPPLIAPVADGPQIVLRGKKDCWVEVRAAGGARLFYGLVRPGETHTMPGPAPWFVYLGYADGIEVTVGGHVVDIPSSRREGVKARFSLAADGTPR